MHTYSEHQSVHYSNTYKSQEILWNHKLKINKDSKSCEMAFSLQLKKGTILYPSFIRNAPSWFLICFIFHSRWVFPLYSSSTRSSCCWVKKATNARGYFSWDPVFWSLQSSAGGRWIYQQAGAAAICHILVQCFKSRQSISKNVTFSTSTL